MCQGTLIRYVEGKHQDHRIAFSDFYNFVLFRENNDFIEFMVHLIHRKRVDEGDGLVAVLQGA